MIAFLYQSMASYRRSISKPSLSLTAIFNRQLPSRTRKRKAAARIVILQMKACLLKIIIYFNLLSLNSKSLRAKVRCLKQKAYSFIQSENSRDLLFQSFPYYLIIVSPLRLSFGWLPVSNTTHCNRLPDSLWILLRKRT